MPVLFGCQLYGELILPGVNKRRNGQWGLRDNDDSE